MAEFYKHSALTDRRYIRVLRVLPSEDIKADLRGELVEEKLQEDDPPSYAAISYTWDNQHPSKEIICDGKTLLVTKNCEDILFRSRTPDRITFLWIDAICINQDDVEEVGQQVGIMGDIYRLAAIVVVWLGESTESTSQAFKYLGAYVQGEQTNDKDSTKSRSSLDDSEKLDKEIYRNMVNEVLQRPWFTRMWTIQEVAMASGTVAMICGRDVIGWGVFTAALNERFSKEFPVNDLQLAVYHRLQPLYRAIKDRRHQEMLHGFSPLAGLINVLVETRFKLCTNPRDKVFALHSLFKQLDAEFPDPDYTKSVKQVFCEATEAVFKQDRQLWFLYHVSSPSRLPELPSWVPDWSDSWQAQDMFDNTQVFKNYHASRFFRKQYPPNISEDGTQLVLKGMIMDRISTCSQALPRRKISSSTSSSDTSSTESQDLAEIRVFQEWIQFAGSLTSYHTGETPEEAFHNAITQWSPIPGCLPPRDHEFPGTSQEEFKAWRAAVMDGNPEDAKAASTLQDNRVRVFNEAILKLQAGNAFFLTKRGDMGLADGTIKEGDLVAMICYMEMPLILRPDGDSYRLIAHAYLHGMMSGEETMPDEYEVEDITLV